MKLAILSRSTTLSSTQLLSEAAVNGGHEVDVLDTLEFAIDLPNGRPNLRYKGEKLPHYDAILPRIGTSVTYYGTTLVRQFELLGVYTPNSSEGIINSRDKLRASQLLCSHDIGIPDTTVVRGRADIEAAIDRVGGPPVVIKLIRGTHGVGVMLARDFHTARAMLQTLSTVGQDVILQRFIAESSGRDIRVLVVGGRVVSAMRRVADGDEFRSNVHLGGRVETAETTPEQEDVAIRAAAVMGLEVTGVDMFETSVPLIAELNSSPGGMEEMKETTGVDTAAAIIEHIADQVDKKNST